MATTSALIAQFYETEGMSHFAHANMTSVLVAQRASPGDIAVSGETITDLSYEFDDKAYAWDKTRYFKEFFQEFRWKLISDETLTEILKYLLKVVIGIYLKLFATFYLYRLEFCRIKSIGIF